MANPQIQFITSNTTLYYGQVNIEFKVINTSNYSNYNYTIYTGDYTSTLQNFNNQGQANETIDWTYAENNEVDVTIELWEKNGSNAWNKIFSNTLTYRIYEPSYGFYINEPVTISYDPDDINIRVHISYDQVIDGTEPPFLYYKHNNDQNFQVIMGQTTSNAWDIYIHNAQVGSYQAYAAATHAVSRGTIYTSTIYFNCPPHVEAGTPIKKTQMDLLKTYLNRGNTVTVGSKINATDGASYKTGPTAGSQITAAWYNS